MIIKGRTLAGALSSTTIAVSLLAALAAAPAHADPGLGSLAGSAGAAGIPTGSLELDTCWSLEPRTVLLMRMEVDVDPIRNSNNEAKITTSSTSHGNSGTRFTLAWQNQDSGDSGEFTSDTGEGRFASRDHYVRTGPGIIEWQVTWAEVWSDQPGPFGAVLPMTTCSGQGSVK